MSSFIEFVSSLFTAPDAVADTERSADATPDARLAPVSRRAAAAMLEEAERPVAGCEAAQSNAADAAARIEAKIEDLDARANASAEEGDASAIEAIEVSLSVERRLLAVARRACDAATVRLDEVRAAAAEARAIVEGVELEARRAELDGEIAPSTFAATVAPIEARIHAARRELAEACREHDAAHAAHLELHQQRVELGGDVVQAVDAGLCTLNLALAAAEDDAARLLAVIRDGRGFSVVHRGLACDSSGVSLEQIVEQVGFAWVTPKPSHVPTERHAAALRAVRDFARTARTTREVSEYAETTLSAAVGADGVEAAANDADAIRAKVEHEALQERMRRGERRDQDEQPYRMPDNMRVGLDTPYARD